MNIRSVACGVVPVCSRNAHDQNVPVGRAQSGPNPSHPAGEEHRPPSREMKNKVLLADRARSEVLGRCAQ